MRTVLTTPREREHVSGEAERGPVLVSEPPSLPECKWDGDADVGGSVRLSCSVAEGVPTPDIRWEKLNPEEVSLPVNMEGKCRTCSPWAQRPSCDQSRFQPHKTFRSLVHDINKLLHPAFDSRIKISFKIYICTQRLKL